MATLKKLTRMGADVRQIARLLQAKAPEGHMLAYITPDEAKLLKSQGGSGQEHEDTGVPSFDTGDSGGYDTTGNQESTPAMQPMPSPVEISSPDRIPNVQANAPVDLGYQAGTTPTDKPVDLSQAAPSVQPQVSAPAALGLPQAQDIFGTTAGPGGYGQGESYQQQPIDTSKDTSTTIGQKYRDLAKGLGVTEDQLGKLGLAGVGTVYGASQSKKAEEQGQAAKREQQALAAPYQQKGAELQRQAQTGELTPASQQQLQTVQAQAAQAASSRGGVGAQQSAAQIEAFRQQLLQNQYDYGLKMSGIGDNIALGAIKTGLEADRYVQQLSNQFYSNVANIAGGMPAQAPQQYQQRTS
jgi:hypothetical protein